MEAEQIQAVVSQEEQSVSQQGAKTAALKGTHVNCPLAAQVSHQPGPQKMSHKCSPGVPELRFPLYHGTV